jgi:hypothetical protein
MHAIHDALEHSLLCAARDCNPEAIRTLLSLGALPSLNIPGSSVSLTASRSSIELSVLDASPLAQALADEEIFDLMTRGGLDEFPVAGIFDSDWGLLTRRGERVSVAELAVELGRMVCLDMLLDRLPKDDPEMVLRMGDLAWRCIRAVSVVDEPGGPFRAFMALVAKGADLRDRWRGVFELDVIGHWMDPHSTDVQIDRPVRMPVQFAVLMSASQGEALAASCLKRMIESGMPVDSTASILGGRTLLQFAISLDDVQSIGLLLESGASLSTLDAQGRDPVELARAIGSHHACAFIHAWRAMLKVRSVMASVDGVRRSGE